MFTLEYSEIFMLMHPSLDKNQVLLPFSVTIDHAKNKNKNSFQSIRNVLKPVHDERVSVKPSLFDQQRSRFLDHQPRFQRNQEKHWKTLGTRGDSMFNDVPSKNRLLLLSLRGVRAVTRSKSGAFFITKKKEREKIGRNKVGYRCTKGDARNVN